MSDLKNPHYPASEFELSTFTAAVRKALTESAQRNGRTVHEEAEHIIKTHLAISGKNDD